MCLNVIYIKSKTKTKIFNATLWVLITVKQLKENRNQASLIFHSLLSPSIHSRHKH